MNRSFIEAPLGYMANKIDRGLRYFDWGKMFGAVRTPELLDKKNNAFLREQGSPAPEVRQCYEEQKDILRSIFGDPQQGLDSSTFFHGTGAKKYKGEKQLEKTKDEVVDVLENVLENGLVPHYDGFLPVHSISLTGNFMYAEYYAEKYSQDPGEIEWKYGDPNDWLAFYLKDSLKHAAGKYVQKVAKQGTGTKGLGNLQEKFKLLDSQLRNWISSVRHDINESTTGKDIVCGNSDIQNNWGAVVCYGKEVVPTVDLPYFETHESRSDQVLPPQMIKAIGVPMRRIGEIKKMLQENGLDLPVFALEAANLYLLQFNVKDLTKRMI